MEARYLVVTDLETTGLNERKHEIIQIAREVIDLHSLTRVPELTWSGYVRPLKWDKREKEAVKVNGLELWFLQQNGESLWKTLMEFSVGVPWDQASLASWGIDFEVAFLKEAFKMTDRPIPYSYRVVDIRSHAFLKRVGFCRDTEYVGMSKVAEELGIPVKEECLHDARYDTWLASEILINLLEK